LKHFLGRCFSIKVLNQHKKISQTYLFPNAQIIVDTKSYIDFKKSLLQEIIQQKVEYLPHIALLNPKDPIMQRTFWIEVVGAKIVGKWAGKIKTRRRTGSRPQMP